MTQTDPSNTPLALSMELAERTKEVVRSLLEAEVIPQTAIPGWIAGAVVTAIVEELRDVER